MCRTLRDARRADAYVVLDERTGLALPTADRAAQGIHYELEGVGVSLFVTDDGLYLQIGRERFDAAEATITYRHDFEAGTTTFEASSGALSVALRYPAWWAQLGLPPEEIMFEPERNEDEDLLAFVAETVGDPGRSERFCAQWRA